MNKEFNNSSLSNNNLLNTNESIKINNDSSTVFNSKEFAENKQYKKSLKNNVKWYEVFFLVCNIFVVICILFFSKEKNFLSSASSIVGCFAIWLLAKGFFFAPIVNIIYDILYIILSFSQSYFSEAIIYLFMNIPIDFYSSFSWKKSKSSNSNVININKIHKKEWLILLPATAIFTIIFYFVFKAINTSQLIISTISFVTSALAGYFLLRRSHLYSLAYTFNDIILISLWSITLFSEGISYLPVVINFICFLTIDTYGFINLSKELKLQNISKNPQ